ncbi:MAG: hypothetical protein Q4C96_09930 [Planctomycetia bacterium]|nr:hypothetical protein [Planctomycetia bacterium]
MLYNFSECVRKGENIHGETGGIERDSEAGSFSRVDYAGFNV